MAFLQRVVNGGGKIEREYGLGRRALDLLVCWKNERHAIELKIRRDTETEADGKNQLSGYRLWAVNPPAYPAGLSKAPLASAYAAPNTREDLTTLLVGSWTRSSAASAEEAA